MPDTSENLAVAFARRVAERDHPPLSQEPAAVQARLARGCGPSMAYATRAASAAWARCWGPNPRRPANSTTR